MTHAAWIRAFAVTAFSLCLGVVVLGAYVRLSNAGLGCPDWPGCYGHFTPAGAAAEQRSLTTALPGRPLEVGKAWREMVHRYAASTLGFLIVCLTAMAIAWRRERIVPAWFAVALLAIVVLQGILGMLTVTWQLKPLVVSLHLLFGFTTLSLLWWLVLTLLHQRSRLWTHAAAYRSQGLSAARTLAALALVMVAIQIALGGWTSSNYAAIACPDFPTCQGSWWPPADFHSAYVLWRRLDVNYEGGILPGPARVAIHLTHRLGAVLTSVALLAAALAAFRLRGNDLAQQAGSALLITLGLQLTIGISMVVQGFPLWLATMHNAGAALLLLATLALNRSLRPALTP